MTTQNLSWNVYNSPKLETAQMSSYYQMDKQMEVYQYNKIPLSHTTQ